MKSDKLTMGDLFDKKDIAILFDNVKKWQKQKQQRQANERKKSIPSQHSGNKS